jgi:ssDNA-binding Zn-finger/Zn-ribbon topoisomerase 1
MSEKQLVCKDCGKSFEFTVGEQEFYTEKGFPDPVRCPECRQKKKDAKVKAKKS